MQSDLFPNRLAAAAAATEAALDRLLQPDPRPGEGARPERLLAAMRHAVLGGGKRIRPFLLIESARLFGRSGNSVVAAAAALECLHCYSLAHDDLPAMDDDDLRRGRPTVHRAFDEATAILAGDTLLTLAFEVLADIDEPPTRRVELVAMLARAAGLGGMAGGQMLDIAAEGKPQDAAAIDLMQAMKTGALIRFACEAGAVLGGAATDERARLVAFGETIGRAFQLADDLIDATGASAQAGKATAKDAGQGKATLVGLYGVEDARRRLDAAVAEAVSTLAPFGKSAGVLADAARFIAMREA